MLVRLRVRDLALIEELDLELSSGFNVLTGETGAGKSLVAAAIGLVLGRKAGPDVVRKGAAEAEVEGIFDVTDEPTVREQLEQAGLPVDDDLLVRRFVPATGRQRCFVNGRLASRAVLADLAGGLASLAGQRDHQSLLDPASQLALLDAFAGLEEDVAAMAERSATSREAAEGLAALEERGRDRASRLDYLAFQLREIDDLDPVPGELAGLDREAERLRHGTLLLETSRDAADELYEADGSIYERLGALARALGKASSHDEALADEEASLAEAAELLEDAARRLRDYGESIDTDPERLEEVCERREALRGLERKHGMDLDALVLYRADVAAEVEELSRYDAALAEARSLRDETAEAARRHAAGLTRKRRAGARKLAEGVRTELRDLAFGDAGFDVSITPTEGDPGPAGADRVDFIVALNPGEGAHSLSRVASGGELSRLMLAARRALAGVGPVGAYVFDEVDAGIGGAVASAVGAKLREVSAHHQVICITHLPQIASLADTHLVVAKTTEKGRTQTDVRRLEQWERVQEIARMLGGGRPTETAEAAARELMGTSSPDSWPGCAEPRR